MKYLTKENLDEISKELIENPTRETLKKLNEKYNGKDNVEKTEVVETPIATEQIIAASNPIIQETPTMVMPNEVAEEKKELFENQNVLETSIQPTIDVVPSIEQNNLEIQTTEATVNNVDNSIPQMPSIELPKLETPIFNNQNNNPVNFNGNLFNNPAQEMGNLMQTTDNFNTVSNTVATTEVPVTPAPFFVTGPESVNNPIPVGGTMNNMPNQGPSMFGQFEQNYM